MRAIILAAGIPCQARGSPSPGWRWARSRRCPSPDPAWH